MEHIYYTILNSDFDLMNDVKPHDAQYGVKECYMCKKEYSATNISKHYKICEKKMSDKMILVKRVQQLEAGLHDSSKIILQKDIQNQKLQSEIITVVKTNTIEKDHMRNQIMQLTLICNTVMLKRSAKVSLNGNSITLSGWLLKGLSIGPLVIKIISAFLALISW